MGQRVTCDHHLGHGLRISDHIAKARVTLKACKHLGTHDFVVGITLAILHIPAETAGKEKYAALGKHLMKVMEEIASLFRIVQYKQKGSLPGLGHACKQRGKGH